MLTDFDYNSQLTSKDLEKLREQVLGSIKKFEVLLSTYIQSRGDNPFLKAAIFLMNSQRPEGYWGSEDYPAWKDVYTAFVIQILSRFGLSLNSIWEIRRVDLLDSYPGGIEKGCKYLLNSIRSNGSWGEDVWDSCYVLKALSSSRYKLESDEFVKGLKHLESIVDNDWEEERDREWYGPGFWANALEVFVLLGDQSRTERLIRQIMDHQQDDGSFIGRSSNAGQLLVPSTWHTGQVVSALIAAGIPVSAPTIKKGIENLKATQNEDGSWGTFLERFKAYWTSYAIIALCDSGEKESSFVKEGVRWLISTQDPEGRVGDLGGTIMAAIALSKVYAGQLSVQIPVNLLIEYIELTNRLRYIVEIDKSFFSKIDAEKNDLEKIDRELEATLINANLEIDTLKNDKQTLLSQFSDALKKLDQLTSDEGKFAVKITQKQVMSFSLIFGLLGIIIVAWAIINFLIGFR